jgi:ArsR family transcriptional regulator, virulence genes transcriptional regulator
MREQDEYEQCADKLKALTDRNRLLLIHDLLGGERTVSSLAAFAGLHITMASHHLSILHKVGIVTARKTGRYVYYALNPEVARYDGNGLLAIDLGGCIVRFVTVHVEPPETRAD